MTPSEQLQLVLTTSVSNGLSEDMQTVSPAPGGGRGAYSRTHASGMPCARSPA